MGYGVIFEIMPGGTESVLYSFANGADGAYPSGTPLLLDASGNFYGTTESGGSGGGGTVFEFAPGGTLTTLYSFTGKTDGSWPSGGVVMDAKGNLYGTARYGGIAGKCHQGDGGDGCGVVFEVTPAGMEKVLYAFQSKSGRYPEAGLLLGKQGELYGTTSQGGDSKDSNCVVPKVQNGCGVVFEVKK